jgi:hypothetical protein
MTIDSVRLNKIPEVFNKDASTVKLDPGPYIGKIKNTLDPTRSGRLQVYIPNIAAGDENNPSNWRTVTYASPFFGSTHQPDTNKQNSFSKVQHTYGMWAVVPDIDNFVLCTFAGGDPNRGFWFACIPNQIGHHMVPGIAGSAEIDDSNIENNKVKSGYDSGKATIVAEFNENQENLDWEKFTSLKKPIHEEQFKNLLRQGLESDYVRGIISSSSQRESPSYVFGISTPGRSINDKGGSQSQIDSLASGSITSDDYAVPARKGGHTFVMDDGDWAGKDRLVRLRTAAGHQILMNDTDRILYIGNSDGSVWVELTGPGHLNIYTGASVNIRAQGDLNFHADKNINFNAGQQMNFSSGGEMSMQGQKINLNSAQNLTLFGESIGVGSSGSLVINSSGSTSINGSGGLKMTGATITLNQGGTQSVTRPTELKTNTLDDTKKDGSGKWTSGAAQLETIVPIAPTHEPWNLHMGTTPPSPISSGSSSSANKSEPPPNGVTSGPAPGEIDNVEADTESPTSMSQGQEVSKGIGVDDPAPPSLMENVNTPTPTSGVGSLNVTQTKALMTQLGHKESSSKYDAVNKFNYLGKYQIGASVLTDQGYIKPGAFQKYGNNAVNYPTSWTGKDGITSKDSYLSASQTQEKVMQKLMSSNYKSLVSAGAIKSNDDPTKVAGMLSVSHLLGPTGANNWDKTGQGVDANGTTGSTYFNMGRYSVDMLSSTKNTAG